MIAPSQPDDLTNRDDFETHLQQLVATARDNDIPIGGAYDIRSLYPEDRDYQIEVSEIAPKSESTSFSTK